MPIHIASEFWMFQDSDEINPPPRSEHATAQRRHINLAHQVSQKCGLGQNLDIEEGRAGLQSDRLKLGLGLLLHLRVGGLLRSRQSNKS